VIYLENIRRNHKNITCFSQENYSNINARTQVRGHASRVWTSNRSCQIPVESLRELVASTSFDTVTIIIIVILSPPSFDNFHSHRFLFDLLRKCESYLWWISTHDTIHSVRIEKNQSEISKSQTRLQRDSTKHVQCNHRFDLSYLASFSCHGKVSADFNFRDSSRSDICILG